MTSTTSAQDSAGRYDALTGASPVGLNTAHDCRPGDRLLHPVDQGPARRRRRRDRARAAPVAHPPGTEVDPRAWRATPSTRPPTASSSAPTPSPWRPAARHGGPATRPGTGARGPAVERHPLRGGGRGPRSPSGAGPRRARDAGRQRAGRVLHGLQAPLDARRRPRRGRPDRERAAPPRLRLRCTWPRPGRRPSPTAATRPARATSPRAEDRWRPDLVAAALGREVALPRVVARGRRRRPDRPAAPSCARHRRQHGRRPRAWRCGRATSWCRSGPRASPRRVSPAASADGTGTVTGFADALDGFLPMVVTLNAAASSTCRRPLLGVDHDRPLRAGAAGSRRRARAHPLALLRRGADAQPSRRDRHVDRPDAATRPAPTWPGRPSRRWRARSPTPSTSLAAHLGQQRRGRPDRRRGGTEPGAAGDRARHPRAARSPCRPRPSTSRSARPDRPPGRSPGPPPLPPGRGRWAPWSTRRRRRRCGRRTPSCATASGAGDKTARREAGEREPPPSCGLAGQRRFWSGGRYWVRTSDLFGVNEARYHCANRPLCGAGEL